MKRLIFNGNDNGRLQLGIHIYLFTTLNINPIRSLGVKFLSLSHPPYQD